MFDPKLKKKIIRKKDFEREKRREERNRRVKAKKGD